MTMNFYSENGEDKAIYELGILPQYGIYVDVGANEPLDKNNTAFLHDLGWDGVSVDALGYTADYAKVGRTFVQAVVSDQPTVKFNYGCHPLLCRVGDNGQTVKARTLESILQAHAIGKLDFLSLDCEGHEYEAFISMRWEDHKPTIVLFEYLTHQFDGKPDFEDRRLHNHLRGLGYRAVLDNGINCCAVLK